MHNKDLYCTFMGTGHASVAVGYMIKPHWVSSSTLECQPSGNSVNSFVSISISTVFQSSISEWGSQIQYVPRWNRSFIASMSNYVCVCQPNTGQWFRYPSLTHLCQYCTLKQLKSRLSFRYCLRILKPFFELWPWPYCPGDSGRCSPKGNFCEF